MLEDLPKNVLSQISERMANPLSGSFVISWAAWNYKFIVILFSNNTVIDTFRLIEEISFPTIGSIATHGIAYPLITALAYLFLYPYPAKFVYKFTRERQRDIAVIRQQIEDETPLTRAESGEIRRLNRQLQDEHSKAMELQATHILDLKNELAARSSSSAPAPEPTEVEKEINITPDEFELLCGFRESEHILLVDIIDSSHWNRVKTEFTLGELVQKGYLKVRGGGSSAKYELTHHGRRVIVENGIISP